MESSWQSCIVNQPRSCILQSLPQEVLCRVIEYLELLEIEDLELVSRQFNFILSDNYVWELLVRRDTNDEEQAHLITVARSCMSLQCPQLISGRYLTALQEAKLKEKDSGESTSVIVSLDEDDSDDFSQVKWKAIYYVTLKVHLPIQPVQNVCNQIKEYTSEGAYYSHLYFRFNCAAISKCQDCFDQLLAAALHHNTVGGKFQVNSHAVTAFEKKCFPSVCCAMWSVSMDRYMIGLGATLTGIAMCEFYSSVFTSFLSYFEDTENKSLFSQFMQQYAEAMKTSAVSQSLFSWQRLPQALRYYQYCTVAIFLFKAILQMQFGPRNARVAACTLPWQHHAVRFSFSLLDAMVSMLLHRLIEKYWKLCSWPLEVAGPKFGIARAWIHFAAVLYAWVRNQKHSPWHRPSWKVFLDCLAYYYGGKVVHPVTIFFAKKYFVLIGQMGKFFASHDNLETAAADADIVGSAVAALLMGMLRYHFVKLINTPFHLQKQKAKGASPVDVRQRAVICSLAEGIEETLISTLAACVGLRQENEWYGLAWRISRTVITELATEISYRKYKLFGE